MTAMVAFEFSPETEASLRRVFGDRLDRAALEALVIEGYRAAKFTAGEVARMLGFETSIVASEWLASRGVPLNYSLEDLEADRQTLDRLMPATHPASRAPITPPPFPASP